MARSRRDRVWNFGARLDAAPPADARADWQLCDPAWIEAAVAHSRKLPAGGWYAVCASSSVQSTPRRQVVAGRELVVWRHGRSAFAAPGACPHLGASLDGARVREGCLECPWHGLVLGPAGHGRWRPLPTHDDGVLFWVRLDDGESPTPRPILPARPWRFVDAVVRLEAACAPDDVLRNRLDPWHGVHLHPYAFARVRVLSHDASAITVRVAYRVLGPVCVEVDARFSCVDRRTVAMTIVAGDGAGSVVETHATPLSDARTAIVEAVLATSDGLLTSHAMQATRWLVRPLLRRAALRLWRDDAAYAERRSALRSVGR